MASDYTRVGAAGTNNSVIKGGDRVGVKLDRDLGTLSFFLNGELQPIGAQGEKLKTAVCSL